MQESSLKRNFSYAFAAQGVALAVGSVTNMYVIAETMAKAGKVIRP